MGNGPWFLGWSVGFWVGWPLFWQKTAASREWDINHCSNFHLSSKKINCSSDFRSSKPLSDIIWSENNTKISSRVVGYQSLVQFPPFIQENELWLKMYLRHRCFNFDFLIIGYRPQEKTPRVKSYCIWKVKLAKFIWYIWYIDSILNQLKQFKVIIAFGVLLKRMIHALCIDFFQKLVGGGRGDLPAKQYDLELGNSNYQSKVKSEKMKKVKVNKKTFA